MPYDNTVDSIIDVCRRLYARGMVAATDGNVSVRLQNGHILATRSGINKGLVTRDDLVELDAHGAQLGGSGKPSTEIGMHLYIYQQRPDVQAVVHAHPMYATGFATARIPLDRCLFPEVIVGFGSIPLAEYATPSTKEVADSLSPFVKTSDAILLANHGAVTYGTNVLEAYFKMEKVEHAAHIAFVATLLGGPRVLTEEDIEKLRRVSVQSYGKDISGMPGCVTAGSEELSEEDVKRLVTEQLHRLGFS